MGRTTLNEILCTILVASYHNSSERIEKPNPKLEELLTFTQLYGQTLVASLMGDKAGHSRDIPICPVACTPHSLCAIVPVFFMRNTVALWDPEDLSSWLSCNCLALRRSILSSKQSHLRGHCRGVGENSSVSTHGVRNLERHFFQSHMWLSEIPQYMMFLT